MVEKSGAASEEYIERLAETISKLGLQGPAALVLHVTRPLAWIGGQMLWALDPFLGGARGARRSLYLQSLAALLEREGGVEELLSRLDRTSKGHG